MSNKPTEPPKALSPQAAFRSAMDKQQGEIAKQLPKGVDADRFVRTALTVVNMNPELLLCTPNSLFAAIMLAAKDGLLPDGKEAVIQPYNVKIKGQNGQRDTWEKQAQYMPMVKGIIKAMYNTGDVAMVDAVAVYEKDEFSYKRGDNPRIDHEPYIGVEDPGQVIAAYAVIKLTNGEIKREVMPRRDIEKVREASKAKDGPGWKNWYDQFAIKAVIKRAAKQLPSSSEHLERVIEHDNQAMDFDFGDQRPALQAQQQPLKIAQQPGQPSRLHSILGNQVNRQPEPQQAYDEPVYFGDDDYHQQQSDFHHE